jgi:transcriptional regulator with XRE-family HTH domain
MAQDRLRQWVRRMMADKRLTQHDLSAALNLSQSSISARLHGGENGVDFKMQEIELLERLFGSNSPLRYIDSEVPSEKIEPAVLRGVLAHVGGEYPGLINADPHEFSEAVLALCVYVQSSSGRPLTRAESGLALRGIKLATAN